jgi:plastocyanin
MRRFVKSGVSVPFVGITLLLASVALTTAPSATVVASASSKVYHIKIKNFMFNPMSIKVTPGAHIEVTNKDSTTHTLTSSSGVFNTGNIKPGHTKSFTAPSKPGTYHYICNIHQYMTGTIIVK